MGSIIEYDNNDPNGIQAINNDREFSLKVYQQVYHQVTGRTEKASVSSHESILVDFDELQQLHYKICQLYDVYKIVAKNEVITLLHDRERKEQFTSFDRFKLYNSSTTSPTLNVIMQYNFSIVVPGSEHPQQYTVTARLNSRIAMQKRIEEDAPPFMRGRIIGFVAENTAEISVEYADYVVARSFIDAFNEWVKGCKKSTASNKLVSMMRSRSHLSSYILKFIFAIVISYFALKSADLVINYESPPNVWARFIIIYFSGFYIITACAGFLGRVIESALDSHLCLSYLNLNKGDERLIDEYKGKNKGNLIRVIITCSLTVVLGVLSSKLAELI
ncbi:hypothetical protein QZQ04_08280 [Serratia marcescens]|nr:hypothetical protein [Serratia marcescens]MDP8634740.1 hypothetical protein [Serratia marcescens]MDP8868241.1 hypothetical protein [Serratia marcescens]